MTERRPVLTVGRSPWTAAGAHAGQSRAREVERSRRFSRAGSRTWRSGADEGVRPTSFFSKHSVFSDTLMKAL
jgi:hypothetical protein